MPTVVPRDKVVRDANSGSFYSSMSNVDIEIGPGNPAAAGVRFRMAQHAFLSHMEFRLGSAFAGVYQAGNVMEDVHFVGGRYGIVTEKTSPAWQFTLLDSSFTGQRDAAIREHEVDLTLVNVAIATRPVGIEIDRGYGDSLWGKDVRFEQVSRAGVVISNEDSVFTQVGFENALAHRHSGVRALSRQRADGRRQGRGLPGGIVLLRPGGARARARRATTRPRPRSSRCPRCRRGARPAIRALPADGRVGQRAHPRRHRRRADRRHRRAPARDRHAPRALFPDRLPQGHRPAEAAAGHGADRPASGDHPALHPRRQSGAIAGVGPVLPILETPAGGDNILSGLGLFTGRVNPRASALLWRSGERSLVEDVKIMGGGGTPTVDGKRLGRAPRPQRRSGGRRAHGTRSIRASG